jgi:hypothetical protein
VDPLFDVVTPAKPKTPKQKGEAIVAKIKALIEWAQSEMARSQQDQEHYANQSRNTAPAYKVGDKVDLSLSNIRTDRPSKKLDDRSAKFEIIEVVGPSSYRLHTLVRIYNVFNVDLLRPAATDPLPSHVVDDPQLPALLVNEEEEWLVESILKERHKKLPGKRTRTRLKYLVKWTRYAKPTWELAIALEDTIAPHTYLEGKGTGVMSRLTSVD